MWKPYTRLVVIGCVLLDCEASPVKAQEFKPGEPVEYKPFFPDKWQGKIMLVPWEGERVVLLTMGADFEPKVMTRFLQRLDAGWKVYEKVMGREPGEGNRYHGKAVIAAAPGSEEVGGAAARGRTSVAGIEVASFYKGLHGAPGDYENVRDHPDCFPHYYFYEMGRNYYFFGDRHSRFNPLFAVAMGYLCMDAVGCKELDANPRHTFTVMEDRFARSGLEFHQAFKEFGAPADVKLKDARGRELLFADTGVLYVSIVLKLRRNQGGDEWVSRFYGHLIECPLSPENAPDGLRGQLFNIYVAASLASGKNLMQFRTRWRFPFSPELWQATETIPWDKKGLTARDVFDALPAKVVPVAIALQKATFITPERRQQNLLVGGTFEDTAGVDWIARSYFQESAATRRTDDEAKEGKKSLLVRSTNAEGNDIAFVQKVKVKPKTRYLLSGWVKTKSVVVTQKNATIGAILCVFKTGEHSESLVGDNDWTYRKLVFDSGSQSEVEVGARLGHNGSVAKGSAWFDDLVLIELGPKPPR